MKNLLLITQKVDQDDQLLGFFIDWLKRLADKFGSITVLCLERGKFDLPKNVKVISLGKDRGAGKLKILFNFYSLIFSLRQNYDAVFVHMNPIWVVAGGATWRAMHKKIYFWYTHKAVTPKLRLAEKFANFIFTASKESFRLPSKKIIITGHGIDTDLFRLDSKLKIQDSKLRILSVGRIAPVKNYEVLVQATKILADEGVDFEVTMVGEPALDADSEYQRDLKRSINDLKLDGRFNFVGKINYQNLPSYYQSHDIFIHLSKTGSLDKTILEAMSCGLTVLSCNDSSRAFLPREYTFDQENDKELAENIKFAALNPKNFREYVIKNHNLDKLINQISATINS